MSRSSWLAIRAPLSSRRAALAKLASFLLPLGLWALVCYLWVPEVVILEHGDSPYANGDRVPRADFEAANAKILAARTEPTLTLTDQSFQSLQAAAVPESVLQKLESRKGQTFDNRKQLRKALPYDLTPDEMDTYGDVILEHAEKKETPLAVGEPSTVIWLPPPHKVAMAFYHAFVTKPNPGDPWLHQSLWHSCKIIFWGFVISAVLGIPLGILCGTFDVFSKVSEPFIDFIRYMPAPAFGVLCVAILGLNDGPKIAIIWIGTFFQMVLVVANTTRQFDESLLEAAQTLGATKRTLLTKVILPGILPNLYTDMRILIGWAWTYLIVAELIGATSGISYFINQQGRYRHFENVYAGIIMIGLLGLTTDQLLAYLARFLFPWVPRSQGSGAWAAFFSSLAVLFRFGRKPSAVALAGAAGPEVRRRPCATDRSSAAKEPPVSPESFSPNDSAVRLPSYKVQALDVQARFRRIYQRPIVMSVKGLGKTFETGQAAVEVLRDINFDVHRREFICVLGQSGCGKSTLIRLLAGLEEATTGTIELDGKPVEGPGPDRGMVFQSYTLFPWLTVKRNVMFGLQQQRMPFSQAEAEARRWVHLVGLSQFMDAYPYQLSGGMKQRVAIARALANQPHVLLMDEPFGALDAQTRAQMQSQLKQIWMNVDVTIVFITHDLDEAVLMADRIILLSARPGRIAEIIEVPILQPRPPDIQLDARFLATRTRLAELIHPRTAHALEPLPIERLTAPGDEVT